MSSAIPAVKAALVAQLTTLFPAAQVLYGSPGTYESSDIIAVGNAQATAVQPVYSANRPREESSSVEVIFAVYRAGGQEQQQVATEAAFAYLSTFADWFKTKPNETVNGTCRNAWVSAYELDEPSDPEVVRQGRYASIRATVTVQARI